MSSSGVKLYPNHFRPGRTMRPLQRKDKNGKQIYCTGGGGTIRMETLQRWSDAAKRAVGVRPPRRRRRKNSRKARRDGSRLVTGPQAPGRK